MSKYKPYLGYPMNVDVALAAIPFCYCGYQIQVVLMDKIIMLHNYSKLLVGGVLIIVVFILYRFNLPISEYGTQYVAMGYSVYGKPALFYLNAFLGSFAIICFSSIKCIMTERIGRITLTILIVHGSALRITGKLLSLVGISNIGWVYCMVSVITTIIASMVMDSCFKKFIPNAIGS